MVGLVNSVTKFKNLYAYKKWKNGLLWFSPVVLNFERGCTSVSIQTQTRRNGWRMARLDIYRIQRDATAWERGEAVVSGATQLSINIFTAVQENTKLRAGVRGHHTRHTVSSTGFQRSRSPKRNGESKDSTRNKTVFHSID